MQLAVVTGVTGKCLTTFLRVKSKWKTFNKLKRKILKECLGTVFK